MTQPDSKSDQASPSRWSTLSNNITAVGGLITAVAVLIGALAAVGVFDSDDSKPPTTNVTTDVGPTSPPTTDPAPSAGPAIGEEHDCAISASSTDTYAGSARNEVQDLNGRITIVVREVVPSSCVVVLEVRWSDGLDGLGEDVTGVIDTTGAGSLIGDFTFDDESYNLVIETTGFSPDAVTGKYSITARQGGATVGTGEGTFTALAE